MGIIYAQYYNTYTLNFIKNLLNVYVVTRDLNFFSSFGESIFI